jgi:hypothetical protein
LIADVADAGGAAPERLRVGRRAGEQILAVAIVPIGDIDQLADELPHLGREHVAFALPERGIRAFERAFAHPLQQQRDVRERLLFVAEAAFDDVGIALELLVVGDRAIERRGARGRDRIFRGVLEALAARDLGLRARQTRLLLEDRADAGAMDGGGRQAHVISSRRSAANRTGWKRSR